jgi:hypothetical protein
MGGSIMKSNLFFRIITFAILLLFSLPNSATNKYSSECVTETNYTWQNGSWNILSQNESCFDSLDRIIMNGKEYFTYDIHGDIVMEIDSFQNLTQIQRFYNISHLCTLAITQIWSPTGWQNSTQYHNQFTSTGLIADSLTQIWQDTTWLNDKHFTVQYAASGKPTTELWQIWNLTFSAWGNSAIYIRAYDSYDSLTLEISANWVQAAWDTTYAFRNTFNHISASLLEKIVEGYNTTHQWVNSERDVWQFDSKKRVISRQYQQGNGTGGWGNPTMTTDNYSAAGYDTCQFNLWWNLATNSLDIVYRTNTPFDSLGNSLGRITWLNDTINHIWQYKGEQRIEYIYDNSNRIVNMIQRNCDSTSNCQNYSQVQNTFDTQGRLILNLQQLWNIEFSGWENYRKDEFIITPNLTSIKYVPKLRSVSIPYLKGSTLFLSNCKTHRIAVYNLNGRLVLDYLPNLTVNQIQFNNLKNGAISSGLYTISVFFDNNEIWSHQLYIIK